jgi:hypothetical protein
MKKPTKMAELEKQIRKLQEYIEDLEFRLKLDYQDEDMTTSQVIKPIEVTLPDGTIRVIKPRK